jgi:hypothetical protein
MFKTTRISAAMFLIVMIFLAMTPADAKTIRRFAVIVGANNGGPDRVRLKYAVSDADAMMNVLKSIGGVSDSDGLLLTDPDRRNFISAMNRVRNEILANRQKNERIEFIFYYSGHSDEEALLLGREKIYYRELKESIKNIPADVRIAILDSCSSGAFTRIKGGKFRPPFVLDSSFNMKGDAFMTSSSMNEASQESDAIRGSFFTHYLIIGLRGAADMILDGRITLNEAYQYAYNETLIRTEKTLGGAQHPSYDIQMSGTGDVVITDIKRKTSGILLDKKIAGKIFIHSSDNTLIAELNKPYGREMTVALAEGKYKLTSHTGDGIFEADINIPEGKQNILALGDMTQTKGEETVLRGDPKPVKKQKKEVVFSFSSIEHGWYASFNNQFTLINNNWSYLAGGKAAWIINHSLAIGAGGYGLVYPTDRDKITGTPYDGIDTKIHLGFGGGVIEYFIWPDRLFTLAPSIMIGAGGIQYYNPKNEDSGNEPDEDAFFLLMPEINIYVNITEYVRIGAGFSFRIVNGINQNDLSDRDISGFAFTLCIMGGWF